MKNPNSVGKNYNTSMEGGTGISRPIKKAPAPVKSKKLVYPRKAKSKVVSKAKSLLA